MVKNINKTLLLFLINLISIFSFSQDFKKDIIRANDFLNKIKDLTCVLEMTYSYSDSEIVSIDTFQIFKKNNVILFKSLDVDYVYFPEKTLTVYKDLNQIFISGAQKDVILKNYTAKDFEDIISRSDRIDFSADGVYKTYSLKMKSGGDELISHVDYEIDSLNNFIRRILTCYTVDFSLISNLPEHASGLCMEIEYKDVEFKCEAMLEERNYILKDGVNYVGVGEFKDYYIKNDIK